MLPPVINLAKQVLPAIANGSAGHQKSPEKGLPPGSPEFWWKICISSGFVLLGGLFAG